MQCTLPYPLPSLQLVRPSAAGTPPAPGGPYAIFDAASGQLLIDAALLYNTWGWGRGVYGQPGSGPAVHRPEVPYIAGQLGRRLFRQLADMMAAAAGRRKGDGSDGAAGGAAEAGGSGLHGELYDGLYDSEELAAVLATAGGGSEVRVPYECSRMQIQIASPTSANPCCPPRAQLPMFAFLPPPTPGAQLSSNAYLTSPPHPDPHPLRARPARPYPPSPPPRAGASPTAVNPHASPQHTPATLTYTLVSSNAVHN